MVVVVFFLVSYAYRYSIFAVFHGLDTVANGTFDCHQHRRCFRVVGIFAMEELVAGFCVKVQELSYDI